MDTFKVYIDTAGEGRWRQLSGNNRIVATSSEGYSGGIDAAWVAARREAKQGDRIVKVVVKADGTADESLLEIVGEDVHGYPIPGEGEVVDPEGESDAADPAAT